MKTKSNSSQLLKSLLLAGLVAGPLAFNAMAANREDDHWSPLNTWSDGTSTFAAWDDPANWSLGFAPVLIDTNQVNTFENAAFDSAAVICVVSNTAQTTSPGQLMCGFGGGGTLLITNGANFTAGFSGIGDDWTGIGFVQGPGTLIVCPGSDATFHGHLWIGQGSATQVGTVIVNGGTLHVQAGEVGCGWNGGTNYMFITNGASLFMRDWASSTLGRPGNPNGLGIMDIGANSKVVVTNNATGFMSVLTNNHQLIAFEGTGQIQYLYNAGNNTTVITALAPPGPTTPVFSAQPTNAIAKIGGTVTFSASASPATGYQWLFNGSPISNGNGISGATTATLTIANFNLAETGGYSVTATNSAASPSDRSYSTSASVTASAESFNLFPVITINGVSGSTYVTEYATSLSGPYTPFSTNTAGAGPIQVIDTNSPLSMARFYLVVQTSP